MVSVSEISLPCHFGSDRAVIQPLTVAVSAFCTVSVLQWLHSLAYPASGFAICWTVLLTGVLTESYKGLTRKRTKHELRPLGMLTHKSSLKVSIVLTDCSCKKRANLYYVLASLNKSLADVMLITPLGRVATWRTRDPCCVSVLRLAKTGRRICKLVYSA